MLVKTAVSPLLALLFFASATPGMGQEAKPGNPEAGSRPSPGQLLELADSNGDGKVTLAEIQTRRPQFPPARFAALDKNGDGVIDTRDRVTGSAAKTKLDANAYLDKLLQKHDADADGRVTLLELTSTKHGFPPAVFNNLDRDRDGALTANDARPGRPEKAPEKKPGKDSAAEREKPKWDADGDGKVTFEEAKQANPNVTRERFDARDSNGDGVLSREDRKK